MNTRIQTLAIGLTMVVGLSMSGIAFAQGMGAGAMSGQMRDNPEMMGGGMSGMSGMGGMGGMDHGSMMGNMMPCPMMKGGMGMMPMLDGDQHIQMRELMHEHRPAQFERMGHLMNIRDDLMAEMRNERPDPEQVQNLHAQMAEIHGTMMADMVRMHNAMHDLLSDEQRQQLQESEALPGGDQDDHDLHH